MNLFTPPQIAAPELKILPASDLVCIGLERFVAVSEPSQPLSGLAQAFLNQGQTIFLGGSLLPQGQILVWPNVLSGLFAFSQAHGLVSQFQRLDLARIEECLKRVDLSLSPYLEDLGVSEHLFLTTQEQLSTMTPGVREMVLQGVIDWRLPQYLKDNGFTLNEVLAQIFKAHRFSYSAQIRISEDVGRWMRRGSKDESEFLQKVQGELLQVLPNRPELLQFIAREAYPISSQERSRRQRIARKLGAELSANVRFDESLEEDAFELTLRCRNAEDLKDLSQKMQSQTLQTLFSGEGADNGRALV